MLRLWQGRLRLRLRLFVRLRLRLTGMEQGGQPASPDRQLQLLRPPGAVADDMPMMPQVVRVAARRRSRRLQLLPVPAMRRGARQGAGGRQEAGARRRQAGGRCPSRTQPAPLLPHGAGCLRRSSGDKAAGWIVCESALMTMLSWSSCCQTARAEATGTDGTQHPTRLTHTAAVTDSAGRLSSLCLPWDDEGTNGLATRWPRAGSSEEGRR